MQIAALSEFARDDKRAAKTGRKSEQKTDLLERPRDVWRAAKTGRSEHRVVLPVCARVLERAANIGNS